MKLQIIAPAKQEPIYKASVHRTGKIGFTIETANEFKISVEKSMVLAINPDERKGAAIYGILSPSNDPNGYKIQKAGKYHSVNAKGFFESLKFIYEEGNITFTVTEIDVEGTKALKFTPKEPIKEHLPF
ncbi:hypothetical protein ACQ33O_02620 [Ferruginibacter sp. SUN002]|uniref:hypothetical protein n=1 Tax=Ferruginibacter sp. SUN002 TaxID=2937789 RepID=UPI003D36DF21